MKKITLFMLAILISLQVSHAQAPDWTRVLQVSTFGLQQGDVVTADATNVFMAGSISGPVTFNGSNFTSVGLRDMIIAKYSNTGDAVWIKQINAQASGSIYANAIKVDASQNIYISGIFEGTATIGSSTITSDASNNAFMAKFDADGNGLWATSFLSAGTGISKITLDVSSNAYLISRSAKLLKFNSSGVKQWEEAYSDRALQAIAIYGTNLYIGCVVQGTEFFGTEALTSLGGIYTGYLVKEDLDGNYISSTVVGGSTTSYGSTVCDIAMDNSGNLIITGAYTQDLVLGTITITNTSSSYYTYIAKCDDAFTFSWANSSTSLSDPYAFSKLLYYRLFTDNSNNIYEYGTISNSFTYGTVPVDPNGGQFLAKFDASGAATSAYALQNTTYDKIFITPAGKVLSVGSYSYNGVTSYGNLYINQYNGDISLDWQKNSTASQSGAAQVNYVKHDASGNTYVHSRVRGHCDYFGTAINNDNGFTIISKHDIEGNLLWANQIADFQLTSWGSGYFGPQFSLDKDNNTLSVGLFGTTLSFGSQTFTNSNAMNDGYVVKYNSSGQFAWAVQLSTDGNLEIYGVTSDALGNVIVSGEFKSQMTVLSHTISAGTVDGIFIFKLDASGNYLWANGYPISPTVWSAMVGTDGSNNIYMGADIYHPTDNILTFGTCTATMVNNEETVLAKFDSNGTPQWVKTYGTIASTPNASPSFPVDIKTDAAGNTYLYGWCENNAVFGTTTLTNPIGADLSPYITKISTSGDVIWAKAIYGKSFCSNYGDLLDLDKNGNVYVGGHFKDLISIEGTTYTPEGKNDFFVSKYSNSGVFQWVKTIPADAKIMSTLSVFDENALTIGGSAGKSSTLGTFPITKKGGSTCVIATLGNLTDLIGENEVGSDESVTIYPNPSSGKFTLGLNNFNGNGITVTVNNLLGNVVKEFTIKNTASGYTQEVDLGNQASGLYFITIKANNLKVVKSFIISNP